MKTILFALFILLLAGGCASERYYTTYDYNFMHERNNVLIHGEGGTVPNAYVLVGETEFHFRLGTGGGRIQPYKKNLYTGGEYWLYLGVQPLDTQIKSVKTITLKRVTIRVGDDEFNMIKRISDIVPGITTETEGHYYFNRREITEVHSTGIIAIDALKQKLGIPVDTRTWSVFMITERIPIDYAMYQEIRLCLDITVEYITGEKAALDQEFIGILDTKKIPIHTRWWNV